MTDPIMMIPIRQSLCIDLIRFSEGRFTPESIGEMAEEQILNHLEREFDEFNEGYFRERALEFAEVYFPHIVVEWLKQDADALASYQKATKPLVWKEVTVTDGSGVRMHYGGEYHYAKVKNGHIVDEIGSYSPSEWASKVAGGTSRNAWRDLWFKETLTRTWVPAPLLRDKARSELRALRNDETDV